MKKYQFREEKKISRFKLLLLVVEKTCIEILFEHNTIKRMRIIALIFHLLAREEREGEK